MSKIAILHIFYCFGDHTTKKKIPHMRRHKVQPTRLDTYGSFHIRLTVDDADLNEIIFF